MKREPVKFYITLIVITISMLVVFTSCETKEIAPKIPEVSTFQMDFSELNNDNVKSKSLSEVYWTYEHVTISVAQVTAWNVTVAAVMALPVASFKESFQHEAIYHANEQYWTWSYNFNLNGIHDAELKGYFEGDSAVWEMRIDSKLAYMGKNHKDLTGGYWKLKNNLESEVFWLNITWSNNGDEKEIKYENILSGDHGFGSYIHYGITTEDYDRFYIIYNAVNQNLSEIEWNAEVKNGRAKNPAAFDNSEWNCWNEELRDMDCEQ